MQTLTVHAENSTELRAVKTVLKAMKIRFEEETLEEAKSTYNPEFMAMIKHGKKDKKAGLGKVIKTADLWK